MSSCYKGERSVSKPGSLATWVKYIDAIPWAPGELDRQEFAAFAKAAFYGIDQGTAFNLVLHKMRRCGAKNLRLSKIRHSLATAYLNGGDNPCRSAPPLKLPPIEPYSEGRLREEVGELAGMVDESFFVSRSPVTTWNRTPAGVLHKLSFPGEHIWVTSNAYSADGCLLTHRDGNSCSAQWISVTG